MNFTPLWAVHISDGALVWSWLTGGFVGLAFLALAGAWRIRDEDIPRVAILTAAFFVASLLHVRVGPTSVHLLLNGLVGVILGWRAGLAVAIGLLLQAVFLQHGGFSTLGINTCIMGVPAVAAAWLFALLQRVSWSRERWFRGCLVFASVFLWILCAAYSTTLLISNFPHGLANADTTAATSWTFHPAIVGGAALLAMVAAWVERRLENAPEFALGFLVGVLTVLLTVLLNSVVLYWGGLDREAWSLFAYVTFVAHLPIAVVEGTILGFTVGFLARVKPEMLRALSAEKRECSADSLA